MQQVFKVCQCYNGSLNAYLDRWLDIISCFDEFVIRHIPRDSNKKANALAQQASGYNVTKKYFNMRKPMRATAELLVLDEPVRPDAPTGLTAQTGPTSPETGLTGQTAENSESAATSKSKEKAEVADWRVPIVTHLKDPGHGAERNIQRLAFKYVLINDELYRRTAEDVLLKCLDSDQARIAMVEVHEGICGRQVRQVVAKLGRAIQDCQGYLR